MSSSFDQARQQFLDGIACFEAGRFSDAEAKFLASLELLPGRASTLTNLAATRLRLGRPGDALVLLDQALALLGEDAQAWSHHGVALAELGRSEEALASHRRALSIDRARPADWHHLGTVLGGLRRHGEAAQAFGQALTLAPGHGEAWFRLGQEQQQLDRDEDALNSYDRALQIDPGMAAAWSARGAILKDLKRVDEAIDSFERALASGGDAQTCGFFLASLRGGDTPAAAPQHYVARLFDQYAETFDAHLVGALRYRSHELLTETLKDLHPGRFRAALDLGCGTGLCAPLLRDMVARIDGIDLSSQMLEKARARGLYERLEQADLAMHLQRTDRRYDLVLSADVFPYLGDLDPVFGGVRRALDSHGWFCFSVEALDPSTSAAEEPGFRLGPHQRYAHGKAYLCALAARHGFEVVRVLSEAIREDQRQPIAGLYVFLTLASAP